ncbi:DUF1932 domain-containing protein [Aquabacter spiritensis]|uniref:3-hydroxyisobutyrate dehydrogenase-like beta-hydroxyacid dehydrogenase n=1 Tax=Aquabacter spiritensis TaxID=933073 RepID=A0A4R3LVZ1_9HYPH|nr:DUF1932 domain-containing protein [Aquabacter spiritensis]TCT04266.1 3-hydroxyisobutyrate dehydrogenase-like beta-hydroxyacid dehydrogenase [Aquabacter spiritensis]
MAIRIALIGYGEVGGIFGADLLRAGAAALAAYDIKLDDPRFAPALRAKAQAAGVRLAASAADAASGCDLVVSAVTADAVLAVAEGLAPHLAPGQIFFDVNSASPETKKAAARAVEASGADYVEGAVMAPITGPRLAVPILAGGPKAAAAADLLNALGMRLRPVSDVHGRASAMKLCRSIMIKGIEALMLDCARAAAAFDVEAEVYASLEDTFPGVDFAKLAQTMAGRVRQHGVRRAAEMREAADMVADLGLDPALVRAVAAAQARGAASALPSEPQERAVRA